MAGITTMRKLSVEIGDQNVVVSVEDNDADPTLTLEFRQVGDTVSFHSENKEQGEPFIRVSLFQGDMDRIVALLSRASLDLRQPEPEPPEGEEPPFHPATPDAH